MFKSLTSSHIKNYFVFLFFSTIIFSSLLADDLFDMSIHYATLDQPHSVYSKDLNSDGYRDLIVANYNSDSISIWINNFDGTFQSPTSYQVGLNPISVISEDLDSDMHNDVIVVNSGDDNISVLFNNGDGTFQSPINYIVGDNPHHTFSADLDSDNDYDIIVANNSSNNISILVNNGIGIFDEVIVEEVGTGPEAVFSVDIDNDSDFDIVVANVVSDSVSIIINNGDGTFGSNIYQTGDGPQYIFCKELNNDGYIDIITANIGTHPTYGGDISVLFNNGDGSFQQSIQYSAGNTPFSVYSEDFDLDNDNDIAVANYYDSSVTVLYNNGFGSFSVVENYSVGRSPISIVGSDLDNDGDHDVITANIHSDSISILLNRAYEQLEKVNIINHYPSSNQTDVSINTDVSITFNLDIDPLTLNSSTIFLSSNLSAQISGEIEYDNITRTVTFSPFDDLKSGEEISVLLSPEITSVSGLSLFNGYTWVFTVASVSTTGYFGAPIGVQAGINHKRHTISDFNGDDYNDIVLINSGIELSVHLNNTNGTDETSGFDSYQIYTINQGQYNSDVAIGDFNCDSYNDIAILQYTEYDNFLTFLYNNGNGLFSSQSSITVGSGRGRGLSVADYNSDGYVDLIVALQSKRTYPNTSYTYYEGGFFVLLNDGFGGMEELSYYSVHNWNDISSIHSGDLNNDGLLDIVVSDGGTYLAMYQNTGDANFIFHSNLDNSAIGIYGIHDISLSDLNKDNNLDIIILDHGSLYRGGGKISFYENLGEMLFSLSNHIEASYWYRNITSSDIDGDGDHDLVVSNGSPSWVDGSVDPLRNLGNFDFQDLGGDVRCGVNPRGAKLADLDNDNDLDIIVGSRTNPIYVLKNRDCYDTDGDTYGDPGHPENICPVDNCPNVYNFDQLDSNGDNIGDACTFAEVTPEGDNIHVQFSNNVDVTFENISVTGLSEMTLSTIAPIIESYSVIPFGAPLYYDVTTDAVFNGNIDICISYSDSGITVESEEKLLLLHYAGDVWENITNNNFPDTVNNIVCGTVSSLSPFALGVNTTVSCCIPPIRGDIKYDGFEGDDGIDISDLLHLVDYFFAIPAGPAPECLVEADVNETGLLDISDLLYLVDYFFLVPSGPAPVSCP